MPWKRTACLAAALAATALAPNMAAALGFGAGADYTHGPGDRTTRTATLALAFRGGPRELTLSGMRYDDTRLGTGLGLTGAAALGVLSPLLSVRASATRYQGQDGFGAWRLRAGPEAHLPTGQRFRVDAARFSSNLGGTADGLLLEAATPLFPGLTGRACYSTWSWNDGLHSQELSAGADVSLLSHLLVLGELGVTRNHRPAGSAPGAEGRADALPPLFGFEAADPGSSSPALGVSAVARMSVRLTFP